MEQWLSLSLIMFHSISFTIISFWLAKQRKILNPDAWGWGISKDFPIDSWCVTESFKGVLSFFCSHCLNNLQSIRPFHCVENSESRLSECRDRGEGSFRGSYLCSVKFIFCFFLYTTKSSVLLQNALFPVCSLEKVKIKKLSSVCLFVPADIKPVLTC